MPYETTWEADGLYQRYFGVLTSPELFESVMSAYNDPRFSTIRFAIKDFLDVEDFDVGVKTLVEGKAINIWGESVNQDIVVAIVATSPKVIASSRMASSYLPDVYPRRIFATVAQARDWIAKA